MSTRAVVVCASLGRRSRTKLEIMLAETCLDDSDASASASAGTRKGKEPVGDAWLFEAASECSMPAILRYVYHI